MPEKKARVAAPLDVPALRNDTVVDHEDVTVLFSPPRELLERSAGREEESSDLTVVQRRSS